VWRVSGPKPSITHVLIYFSGVSIQKLALNALWPLPLLRLLVSVMPAVIFTVGQLSNSVSQLLD
jgi:hypothetical protein